MYVFTDPAQGLARLGDAASPPYALIISVGMDHAGEKSILEQVRTISPQTQRLLVYDSEELSCFINEINSANIHACLPLSATDDAFLQQAILRTNEYRIVRKRLHLQQTIQFQNKQLYQIAANFKKKETVCCRTKG